MKLTSLIQIFWPFSGLGSSGTVVVPTTPGMEWTLDACPMQWTLETSSMHWTLDKNAMQWTMGKDH